MARIALCSTVFHGFCNTDTTLFLTAMLLFFVLVISLERARNKQFPSPGTWSIVRGSSITLGILGVKRNLRTDNPSLCAAWFRQLESSGVYVSVNVVGVVVTMSLSSEDEESDQGWSVNSDSGHDMVGGDGIVLQKAVGLKTVKMGLLVISERAYYISSGCMYAILFSLYLENRWSLPDRSYSATFTTTYGPFQGSKSLTPFLEDILLSNTRKLSPMLKVALLRCLVL